MKKFLQKLPFDKIKINWNKRPIRMDQFLSFLTVDVEVSRNHLGYENGWTRYYGDNGLIVGGGIIRYSNGSVEYLDSLQYGEKLDNPYNNFVNPFYLFEIMNDEGKRFFLEYYSEDIQKELDSAQKALKLAEEYKNELFEFWDSKGFTKNPVRTLKPIK